MFKVPRVNEQVMDLKDIEKLFNERRFRSSMESNIAHVLSRTGKKTKFLLTSDTSEIYTDGKKIVVGLPNECVGMKYGEIYSIVKASVGHESAHVKWSNFNVMKEYLQEVARRKVNQSVGHSIFNIVEDGRIERLLCEELPGYTKHIKFLNLTLIKKDGKLKESEDVLSNIIGTMLYLSVLGIYPLNYKDILDKKERDLIDNKIYPLILKGVMTNSFSVHKNVCLEILDLIKDYIPKQMPKSLQQMLSELAQETYTSSEGEDGKDDCNLDDKVKSIIKRQKSKSSSNEPDDENESSQNMGGSSSDSSDNAEEKEDNLDDKSLNQNEVKSDDKNEQDESDNSSANSSKSEDSNSNESDESDKEKSSEGESDSVDDNKEDTKEDNNDASSDSKDDSKDGKENDKNDSSNDKTSDSTNKDSNEKSDNDNQDSDTDNLDDDILSNPIPNHVGDISGKSDSLSYEDSEKDFFENLKQEIEEEAVRAFERVEKEEKRAKANEANSYHESIDLSSINSNYSTFRQEPNFRFTYPDYPTSKPQAEFKMKIHGLRKTFEKMLKNDETHYKGQKRGRLDSSRLWRLGINDDSVFKKRNIEDKADYAVEILIDISGSMHNRYKYKNAIGTAICIESALTGLDGVEVKTVAFNFDDGTKMRVLKDFKDTESKTPSVYDRYITGGCNRDGFAIRVALDDLKKHGAKNKLLIVISDGMPSCDIENVEDSIADVKSAVHSGRKVATIVSILINNGPIHDSTREVFHHMYENKGSIMVDVRNNPEDLMKNMVIYLKRMFKK